jgi:peptide/nickel transport system substrate-binding protein
MTLLHRVASPAPHVLVALLLCVAARGIACRQGPPAAAALRVVMAPEVLSLDPHRQTAHGGFSVVSNLYEGLTALDKDMRVVPGLAVAWDSPDELTWRFHLRPGVLFHDGRPLRAMDVVRSLERARQAGSSAEGELAVVSEITSPDSDTVVIRTARPNPMLLTNLTSTFVMPADAPEEIRSPVGTGPYRFVRYRPGEMLELRAWEKHWSGGPSVAEVSFRFEPDPGRRLELLARGKADVALRLSETATSEPRARYRILSRSAPGALVVGLRMDRPPFSDLRLRRAVNLAIDRRALTRELLGGRVLPLGQPLPPGIFGHAPELAAADRDLAAARRLVREVAGDANLAVTLEHGPGRQLEAERVAGQIAESGLRVSLHSRDVTDLLPSLDSGESHMVLFSLVYFTGDTVDFFESVLHSRGPAPGYGAKNWYGYANADVDALIESASRVPGMAGRLPGYQRALRLAMDDLPIVPLWEISWVYGVGPDVEWTPAANGWFSAASVRRRS